MRLIGCFALAVMVVAPVAAQEDVSLSGSDLIDAELRKVWTEHEVKAAPRASDAEFLRRATLDIIGTIPTLNQTLEFLSDDSPDKRKTYVETLLDDPRYYENWAQIWAGILIGFSNNARGRYGDRAKLEDALEELLKKEQPYDEFVKTLVSVSGKYDTNPKEAEGNNPLVLWYMQWRFGRTRAQNIGGKMSKTFLGIQIQCAQCHDHPFDQWTQDDFKSMAAFFEGLTFRNNDYYLDKEGNRVTRRQIQAMVKKDGGRKNIRKNYKRYYHFEVGDPDPKRFQRKRKMPQRNKKRKRKDTTIKEDPVFMLTGEAPEKDQIRRTSFADYLTSRENRQFSRAYLNRMWFYFFGRGVVEPFDNFTARNRASVPKLMEKLVDDFVAKNMDMKYVIRSMVLSDAYQRSSSMAKADRDPANIRYFAFSKVRPLTPEQMLNVLLEATGAKNTKAGRRNLRQQMQQQFRHNFGDDEGNESADFEGSMSQALFLMNGSLLAMSIEGQQGSTLAQVLEQLDTTEERVETIFLAFLTRRPSADEKARFVQYVEENTGKIPDVPNARNKRLKKALEQKRIRAQILPYEDLAWVLVNSSEFIFNH